MIRHGWGGHITSSALVLVMLVVLAVHLGAISPARAGEDDLFGSRAIRSENMAAFPRWTGVIARYLKGEEPRRRVCRGEVFDHCRVEEWKQFLDGVAGLDPMTQMRLVNERINRARYVLDFANYGESDYWATPAEFYQVDGDCEDYAIAKFLSLRTLGFPNESLRLVILDDLNLRAAHAVLVVMHEGKSYVLDNQIGQVVPSTVIRHYKPIYSLNETNWWLYRPSSPMG